MKRAAATLIRRGLLVPALIALEAGRPLAPIGSQLLWIAQPALSLFWPRDSIDQFARLLEKPEAVEQLIDYLNGDVPNG